ncbi:MAG: oligosaccharide flippase family protein [Pseudomonadota bacterium]
MVDSPAPQQPQQDGSGAIGDSQETRRAGPTLDERQVKRQVGRGLAWVGGASSAIGVLDLVVGFLLTIFWLSPAEFGVAILATWLFPVFDLFTDAGLSSAIIQGEATKDETLTSLFVMNLFLSALAAALILLGAGVLTGHPTAAAILRIYSAKLVFHNSYFIPQALLKRELRFKELSLVRVGANIANSLGKVVFAATGFGAWCFLFGHLAHTLVTAIGIQYFRPWRPRFPLRLRESAPYVKFGLKTAAREILFHFYTNVDYRVVYAFFGEAATGVYRFAYERVLDSVRTISLVVTDVAFPTFARLASRRQALIEQFIGFTRANLAVIVPIMAFLAIEGDDFIRLIWPDERWLGAVPAMRIFCLVGVLRALSFVVPPLFDGLGKPTVPLLYTAFAATLLPCSYLLGAWLLGPHFGHLSVAIAWTIGYPIAFLLLFWLALSILELPVWRYLRRVLGIPLCVAAASVPALAVRVLLDGRHPGLRLAAVTVTLAAALLPLLARFEGITRRSIADAVRGGPGN